MQLWINKCNNNIGYTFIPANAHYHLSHYIALSPGNPAMASQTSVSIRILDVNDNPPELATPYEASICEDAKPGQVR